MNKVFISGSIAVKKLPREVMRSLDKILNQNFTILVGDAPGIDTLVQNYCQERNYSNVTVYSIHSPPRYKVKTFKHKFILPKIESKRERELQQEKDKAMTFDSDYSLVVWDGKSKGSYSNILRAIKNDKKVKVFYQPENQYLETTKVNSNEIEFVYRKNNGYAAKEVVELLLSEGEEFFQNTRMLNKCLLDHDIIKKEDGIYKPSHGYEELFIIEKYRGKTKGIKFKNEFINWIENWLKQIKIPEQQGMF
jgi:hypothetical protein